MARPGENGRVFLFAFVLLCFIWGSSWIAIKFSLMGFPPFMGAGIRFALAVVLLLLYARWKRYSLRVHRPLLGMVVLTGTITYLVDYGLVYWAEQYLTAGVTAVLFGVCPLFTMLTSSLLFRLESVRPGGIVGLGIGFFGILVIFGRELSEAQFQGLGWWAGAAVLGSAVGAAIATVLVKKHLRDVQPVVLSIYQMALGAVGLLTLGGLAGETISGPINWPAVGSVIYLAAVASALAFTLYFRLLQDFSPTTMSLIVYVTPVTALFVDWLVLGEVPSQNVVLGVGLILAGILVYELPKYRARLKARRAQAAQRVASL